MNTTSRRLIRRGWEWKWEWEWESEQQASETWTTYEPWERLVYSIEEGIGGELLCETGLKDEAYALLVG